MVPDSDSVALRRQTQFLSMSEPYSSSVTLSRTIFLIVNTEPAGSEIERRHIRGGIAPPTSRPFERALSQPRWNTCGGEQLLPS